MTSQHIFWENLPAFVNIHNYRSSKKNLKLLGMEQSVQSRMWSKILEISKSREKMDN